tara:strand:+ start:233 stop:526 length:294 start_codon:yes stop_codon:yes gene_type:complete
LKTKHYEKCRKLWNSFYSKIIESQKWYYSPLCSNYLTINGERIELSLKRRITLNLWNEKRSRLKGYSEESLQANKSLGRIYNKIYEAFRQLQEENKL